MRRKKNAYIITLIISSILISGMIAVLSIYTTRNILEEHSAKILDLQCQKTAIEFDTLLERVEQAVNMIASEASYSLKDLQRFREDEDYVNEYTKEMNGMLFYAAANTKGAMSVYIRYNPDLTSSTAGAYLVRDEATGIFVNTPTTDLLNPDGEDMTWYDIPVEKGRPVWLGPYPNYHVGYDMISYVVPYYLDGVLVGVVGMDIDCVYIKELLESIDIYDTGYALLLAEDGQVVAHKNYALYDYMDFPQVSRLNELMTDTDAAGQYQLEELGCTIAWATTKNNMLLGVLVPDKEIYAGSDILMQQITVIGAVALAAFSALTVFIIRKLYRLAENDELTGIYNRKFFMNAFRDWEKGKGDGYSLFLFDIDCFKQINDNYGHNNGDFALKEIAKLAKNRLGKSSLVARWGGDEFIGILPAVNASEVLECLRSEVEQLGVENHIPITISIGYVDMKTGEELKDITEKADKALYESKDTGKNKITCYKDL